MDFQDRILRCVDCGAEFVWTAGEQQFYADKNFKNEPKRCKACKGKRASRPAGGPVMRGRRLTSSRSSIRGAALCRVRWTARAGSAYRGRARALC